MIGRVYIRDDVCFDLPLVTSFDVTKVIVLEESVKQTNQPTQSLLTIPLTLISIVIYHMASLQPHETQAGVS